MENQPIRAGDATSDEHSRSWFLETIRDERGRQDAQWGMANDDAHSGNDWIAIIAVQSGKLERSIQAVWESGESFTGAEYERMKRETTELAAVCCAFFEYCERWEEIGADG